MESKKEAKIHEGKREGSEGKQDGSEGKREGKWRFVKESKKEAKIREGKQDGSEGKRRFVKVSEKESEDSRR